MSIRFPVEQYRMALVGVKDSSLQADSWPNMDAFLRVSASTCCRPAFVKWIWGTLTVVVLLWRQHEHFDCHSG